MVESVATITVRRVLTNCTITGNSTPTGGSCAFCSESSLSLINCILFNEGNELGGDGSFSVSYCCVEGGWPSEGNMDEDPMFVDPENGDYHLQPGSPCIDAGNNDAIRGIHTDLDGKDRIWDGDGISGPVVDMGVFEFGALEPVAGDTNGDSVVNPIDPFFFSTQWYSEENATNYRCNVILDATIDERDLLWLIGEWKE